MPDAGHELERSYGLSATELLDAVNARFRLKVALEGAVAEIQMAKKIAPLVGSVIARFEAHDLDGHPDFSIWLPGQERPFRAECKNARNDGYQEGGEPAIGQHSPDLAEHCDHSGDVSLYRRQQSQVVVHAIVAKLEIGRAGDAAVDGLGFEFLYCCLSIIVDDLNFRLKLFAVDGRQNRRDDTAINAAVMLVPAHAIAPVRALALLLLRRCYFFRGVGSELGTQSPIEGGSPLIHPPDGLNPLTVIVQASGAYGGADGFLALAAGKSDRTNGAEGRAGMLLPRRIRGAGRVITSVCVLPMVAARHSAVNARAVSDMMC
jgi:hypothetical protein